MDRPAQRDQAIRHDVDQSVPRRRSASATRDHLANERTLLAWVRTCLAIMALGGVVARLSLLGRAAGPSAQGGGAPAAGTFFGVVLIGCATALIILALLRYRQAARSIEEDTYYAAPGLITALVAGFVVVALLLAIYLVATT